MSKLTCLFVGTFPVLVVMLGSYLASTALNSFWAAPPADRAPRTGGPRQPEYGTRYRLGHSLIVGGLVLLVGVIVFGIIGACVSDFHVSQP